MKRTMPLRIKMTLLCALIITVIAAGLTAVSVFNVDRLFLKSDLADFTPKDSVSTFAVESKAAESVLEGAEGLPEAPLDQANAITVTMTARNTFASSSLIFMAALIVAGAAAAYFIMGRALKPVGRLAAEVRRVDENNLSVRLGGNAGSTEIARLTESFNSMIGKLDRAFTVQKRFAQAAAHELKTPLACMQANLEVLDLDEAPSEEDYRETVQVVRRNTGRLIELVDDLLNMNAGDDGRMEEIPAAELVGELLADLRPKTEERGLAVTEDCSGTVSGNRALVTRAAANLVENAVKYNVDGGKIRITSAEKNGFVELCVANTGRAIPEDELERVFEAFYRVDQSRSRDVGGSGLGLALVREIAGRCGGAVWAENKEGYVMFTLRLPAA